MTQELLRLDAVTKRFAGVTVVDEVSLGIRAGEVHVLLGENGAGKSTLIKMMAGAHRPDGGRILIGGVATVIESPLHAQRLGIGTIFQELNLVPELTVAENILLGRQPRRFGLVSKAAMLREAEPWLRKVGLDVAPSTRLAELGVAKRQLVEIAKALSLRSRILVLDEPTAALTGQEVERLFALMRQLRQEGVGQLFISHHLEEIPLIGDRITVLRDGRAVGELPADAPEDELIRLMVGRPIDEQYPPRPVPVADPDPALVVDALESPGRFESISFEVRPGEVLGIAGLVGSGRTEVLRAIGGADPYRAGSVLVRGRAVPGGSVTAAVAAGIGHVPEDRKGQGLVLGASVLDNIAMSSLRRRSRYGFVQRARQTTEAAAMTERLRVRMRGLDQSVGSLSGGNQQKVVIGKWMLAGVKVLLLDEPTRGVDVGARVEIYELINEFIADGGAIVLVSSDLPEVLGVADRILVMSAGRIAGELAGNEASQESVMRLAITETEASGV